MPNTIDLYAIRAADPTEDKVEYTLAVRRATIADLWRLFGADARDLDPEYARSLAVQLLSNEALGVECPGAPCPIAWERLSDLVGAQVLRLRAASILSAAAADRPLPPAIPVQIEVALRGYTDSNLAERAVAGWRMVSLCAGMPNVTVSFTPGACVVVGVEMRVSGGDTYHVGRYPSPVTIAAGQSVQFTITDRSPPPPEAAG